MARPVTPIQLTTEQSEILNDISRRRELPHSTVQRVQIILAAATGQGNKAIGKALKNWRYVNSATCFVTADPELLRQLPLS